MIKKIMHEFWSEDVVEFLRQLVVTHFGPLPPGEPIVIFDDDIPERYDIANIIWLSDNGASISVELDPSWTNLVEASRGKGEHLVEFMREHELDVTPFIEELRIARPEKWELIFGLIRTKPDGLSDDAYEVAAPFLRFYFGSGRNPGFEII